MPRLAEGAVPRCWRALVDGLESRPEAKAVHYNLAHFQGALDDLEHAISVVGGTSSPAMMQELNEYRRKFDELVRVDASRLKRLGDLEIQDLLGRYRTYLSDLDELLDPELRQGEVYSIVSVRDTIESLLRLPEPVRPSGNPIAEILRLDRRLQEFIARVPWASWVADDYGTGFIEWYAGRFWWWGKVSNAGKHETRGAGGEPAHP